MFPYGAGISTFGIKVAGRSQGQFPNATLHAKYVQRNLILYHRSSRGLIASQTTRTISTVLVGVQAVVRRSLSDIGFKIINLTRLEGGSRIVILQRLFRLRRLSDNAVQILYLKAYTWMVTDIAVGAIPVSSHSSPSCPTPTKHAGPGTSLLNS